MAYVCKQPDGTTISGVHPTDKPAPLPLNGIYDTSPNGHVWRLEVANNGTPTWTDTDA